MAQTDTDVLSRSIPSWPSELQRYSKVVKHNPVLGADYTIQCKEVDGFRHNKYGIWEGIVHPSGVMYYFEASTKTYTGFDIQRCSDDQLLGLQNWIDAARRKLQEDAWFLVVEPITKQNGYYYEYYCAVPDKRVITWFEVFNADLLFQECACAREWNHKRLELEAQFWKHVDFFPRHFNMKPSEAIELRIHLEWYLAEGLTLQQSTAASLFWNIDQTERIISRIENLEKYTNIDGFMKEQGVAFCGRIWNILRHHQFLNYYGLPEARLMRSHSVEANRQRRTLPILLATAAMFGVPVLVLEHIESLHVDGIVNSLDIDKFVDHFNNDNLKHSTLAGVIMAVDAGILAIPSIGSQTTTIALCSVSLILCVHCIFASVVAQHFGQKMKSLEYAVRAIYHAYSSPLIQMY
ncbi:hypothetical protein P692DRAFT_20851542 [Suillus brevipes Sb2]|nr:hypothetical protein P692DRAFT_20851542 [Suillus brevipes Sb2]